MIPFTIEDIKAAYVETGLGSLAKTWLELGVGRKPVCACPIAAIVIKNHGIKAMLDASDESDDIHKIGEILDVPDRDIRGFVRGFDGDVYDSLFDDFESFIFGAQIRTILNPKE